MAHLIRFPLRRAFLTPKIRRLPKGRRPEGEVIIFPGPRRVRMLEKARLRMVTEQRDVLKIVD